LASNLIQFGNAAIIFRVSNVVAGNQEDKISLAKHSEAQNVDKHKTFASFQRRAPVAVPISIQSAARMSEILLVAIQTLVPVQQNKMAS